MIKNTSKNPKFGWLLGGNPDAIILQEKQGQDQLVEASKEGVPQLPSDCRPGEAKETYEKLGIEVIGPSKGDDLFLDVKLPEGWIIVPTKHQMHSLLKDEKGRTRVSIFYKAAFYDRKAHSTVIRRFKIRQNYFEDLEFEGDYYQEQSQIPISYQVFDQDEVVFETEHKKFSKIYTENEKQEFWAEENNLKKSQEDIAQKWLEERYPDWKNDFAYWDE